MQVITKILNANSVEQLQKAIIDNHIEIIDKLSQINHKELIENKDGFRRLSLKEQLFNGLDFKIVENVSTINAIINTSIRLGDTFVFQRFYRILENKQLEINSLIKACSLFMLNVKCCDDLINRFSDLHISLELAFQEDEDNNKNVIVALIHYYLFFIKNFIT